MKTLSELRQKPFAKLLLFNVLLLLSSCSTVREQGEPETGAPTVITTDEQRRAIYERGTTNTAPQNANPIPPSEQLGLDEKASDINRKKNIENMNNPNAPANTPLDERPRQLPQQGNDTIIR